MKTYHVTLEVLGDFLHMGAKEGPAWLKALVAYYGGRLIRLDAAWVIHGEDGMLIQLSSAHPQIFQLLEQALKEGQIHAFRIALQKER